MKKNHSCRLKLFLEIELSVLRYLVIFLYAKIPRVIIIPSSKTTLMVVTAISVPFLPPYKEEINVIHHYMYVNIK